MALLSLSLVNNIATLATGPSSPESLIVLASLVEPALPAGPVASLPPRPPPPSLVEPAPPAGPVPPLPPRPPPPSPPPFPEEHAPRASDETGTNRTSQRRVDMVTNVSTTERLMCPPSPPVPTVEPHFPARYQDASGTTIMESPGSR